MSDNTVVTENDLTSVVEVTSAGPAGPPGGALTIQDEGVDEGLLTDKINFAGSTVSVVNDTEAEIATVTVNAADPGANTNITSLGGITGGISSPDYVQFDTAAAAAGAVGRLLWNDTDGTLEFQLKGGNVTLQIGQEQVIRVTNTAGVTMTDGQAVYITGSTGNHLNVTLAQANAEATSSKTLAVVTETIANNNTGFATSSGLVRGLDTSALTEGAAIWLSPTVPGGLTSIKPVAPNHAVLIGWCVRQHASVGAIYVHIANGYELDELHDVLITAAANNQVLRYDAATGLWKNATISPTLTLTGDVSGSATFTDLGNATLTATVADDSHNHIISNVDGLQDALDSKLPAASYTAADVLTKIKTVDGTGSGLDADLLDGQDGAHYLDFTNATNKPDPTITLAGDATGSVTLTDLTSGTLTVTVADDSHNHIIGNVDGLQDALDSKLPAASYTATDVLDKIKTVDGAGSGLDADMLDGQSSAYYTAINDRLGYTAENAANKGIAGGYASLDGAGLVPATQLPSYVDDVLEFANLAAFPVTGETGKIYVAVDTSKTYRWSGSTYVEISASPGSTDAVPEGSTNLYFTTARARQSISASGSLSYDNSTGVVSYTTPNTDGIAEGTTNLYHTTARARGAVSAGTGISYNSSTGVITNAAPDQTVAITGSGTTTVSGTYPNFTVSSADQYVGTVTSVSGTGTVNGLTLTGSVTSSGSLTLGGTLSVDLSTATVTGTLPVTKGGTGVATLGANYLLKGNDTSAVSASVVYDDGTNVGIGTSSPGARLTVQDSNQLLATFNSTAANAGYMQFQSSGSNFGYIGSGASLGAGNATDLSVRYQNNLIFNYQGTERARIDASGNLLVGGTTSVDKLTVTGNIATNSTQSYIYSNGGSGSSVQSGFFLDGSGKTLRMFTNTTERARIDPDGNFGIGNTIPGSYGGRLVVGDPADAFNNNVLLLTRYGTAGLVADGVTPANGVQLDVSWANGGQGPLRFTFSGTERMRLDSSGNLLVGTSTVNGIGLTVNSAGGTGRYLVFNTSFSGGYSAEVYQYNGTTVGSVVINTTSTAFNTSSDARLKENIADAATASNLIDAIKVRQFDWKADGSHQRYGFIAQELLPVAPEAVSVPSDPDQMMGVDYAKLVPMLVKELQSVRARLAILEGN